MGVPKFQKLQHVPGGKWNTYVGVLLCVYIVIIHTTTCSWSVMQMLKAQKGTVKGTMVWAML